VLFPNAVNQPRSIELAGLVGTSQSAIVRLEKGNYSGYSLKTLQKIAKALNATVEIIFRLKTLNSRNEINPSLKG
jgi:transcriptional regulator with XRE-family HTH domain